MMNSVYNFNNFDDLLSEFEQPNTKDSKFYEQAANYIRNNCKYTVEPIDILVKEMISSLKEFSCINEEDYYPQPKNSIINMHTGNITQQCSSKVEYLTNYYRNFLIQYVSVLNISQSTIILSSYIFNKYYHLNSFTYHCSYCFKEVDSTYNLHEKNCHSWMANIREIVVMIIYICNKFHNDDAQINLTGVLEAVELFHPDVPMYIFKQLEIDILHSIMFSLYVSGEDINNYINKNICEMVIGVVLENPKCHTCQRYINEYIRNRIPTFSRKISA